MPLLISPARFHNKKDRFKNLWMESQVPPASPKIAFYRLRPYISYRHFQPKAREIFPSMKPITRNSVKLRPRESNKQYRIHDEPSNCLKVLMLLEEGLIDSGTWMANLLAWTCCAILHPSTWESPQPCTVPCKPLGSYYLRSWVLLVDA